MVSRLQDGLPLEYRLYLRYTPYLDCEQSLSFLMFPFLSLILPHRRRLSETALEQKPTSGIVHLTLHHRTLRLSHSRAFVSAGQR